MPSPIWQECSEYATIYRGAYVSVRSDPPWGNGCNCPPKLPPEVDGYKWFIICTDDFDLVENVGWERTADEAKAAAIKAVDDELGEAECKEGCICDVIDAELGAIDCE